MLQSLCFFAVAVAEYIREYIVFCSSDHDVFMRRLLGILTQKLDKCFVKVDSSK